MSTALAFKKEQEKSPWRGFLGEHGRKLLLFARQQTRSEEDAEDVLQDAMVKLIKKLDAGDFVGGEEAWVHYLYATIRRLAMTLGRSAQRRKVRVFTAAEESLEVSISLADSWFECDEYRTEMAMELEKGLKKLPRKFAEVITMKIWGQRTFAQIGQALGVSQNTAASRYRYGLEYLRRMLTGNGIQGCL